MMNIGKAIILARKQKKITQHKLAEMAEVTQTYISLIESGKKEPSFTMLKRLAVILDVPIPLLMLSAIDDNVPEEKRDLYEGIVTPLKEIIQEIYKKE